MPEGFFFQANTWKTRCIRVKTKIRGKVILWLLLLILAGNAFKTDNVVWAEAGGTLEGAGIGSFGLPEWLEAKAAKGLENQPNAGVQYDLVGFSTDTWHYARLVAYKMEQNLGVAAMLFGVAEANPQVLGELARPLLEKSLADNGGKILEWSTPKKAPLGGRNVPAISARLIMTEKVPLPMAATVYVFMYQDRLFALGLFSPDSDRQFWAQQFRQMATTLKWKSVQ
jgi:hypothetical protein